MDQQKNVPDSLNLSFLESLYADYCQDPQSIPLDWRRYFRSSGDLFRLDGPASKPKFGPSFKPASVFNPAGKPRIDVSCERRCERCDIAVLQERVGQLVRAYRVRGHMIAQIDPLGLPRPEQPELDPAYYGFQERDWDRPFSSKSIAGADVCTLREIINQLRNTYCRSIGVQFMHIDEINVREWLQERMESTENRLLLSRKEQLRVLTCLTDAVVFEEFIHKKYVGAKSFSLEGCESLIPLLDMAIEKAGQQGIEQIVLGVSHRGRLNILANIMGKHPQDIFREFEDIDPLLYLGGGEVKYHMGYETDLETALGHKVHLSLCFNPAHLEFINPVALGRLRAKQDRIGDVQRERGMAIEIHGDASFAGQGIVQETLNLSGLGGYSTGGTLHVIVNNQIGFTTSPAEGRSNIYATAVAKMLQIPIFHVNGEDPEAVAQVTRLAIDFRQTFQRDVVIDMYGYRRYGHNEADDPTFTQPVLYQAIKNRQSVRDGYLEHLLKLGGVTRPEAEGIALMCRENLEKGLSMARSENYQANTQMTADISSEYTGGPDNKVDTVDTAVDRDDLSRLLTIQTQLPQDFHLHPKLQRWMNARREMAEGQRPLDWAAAETLAFASLATQGVPVRMSGEDTARGTFGQRHAVLYDFQDGHTYIPLQHLDSQQATVEIHNSPLSEAGVLGFEYGYSLARPEGLVLWEAQFGDFSNAAQVIIDQFIASAEDKWRRLSGIVLLLPHGFEGQGPEHSSARLERFLLSAAEDNIQIVYPTTPAQYFHCLRRQILRHWRKPLVIMTPKSLLRHPKSKSTLDQLSQGNFQRIIPDHMFTTDEIRRILLCTGKIYYELLEQRHTLGRKDVAIVRLEQLYPLHQKSLQSILSVYKDGTEVFWVQEEPENMGPWRYLRIRFGDTMFNRLPLTGVFRPESASPATGSANSHKLEQRQLIDKAFEDSPGQV
ncbi:MAG: 2-oxoglutarate dehydrogenase E1 component [Planctomycetota bacterium]|jgi:2-oxoglutarate dehydrogenase E1 component